MTDKVGLRPRSNSTDAELKLPSFGLCKEQEILLLHKWSPDHRTSSCIPGLNNLGNTCFMNSVLQCLMYSPSFSQTLLLAPATASTPETPKTSRIANLVRQLVATIHGDGKSSALSPNGLAKSLRNINSRFRLGRQEDAHEFLVSLLDNLQTHHLLTSGIDPTKSGWRDRLPMKRLDETTMIHRICGGYYRSQLKCPDCGFTSPTYDPFLDLSLDITTSNTLDDAIRKFCSTEILSRENRWTCSGCKKKVKAEKSMSIYRPSVTLTVQLKRFKFNALGFGGGKISKKLAFPLKLQLPLSDSRKCNYELTGLVVHAGGSCNSGHYYSYIKAPNGAWFLCDDSHTRQVQLDEVLGRKDAYLLFYSREEVKLRLREVPVTPQHSDDDDSEVDDSEDDDSEDDASDHSEVVSDDASEEEDNMDAMTVDEEAPSTSAAETVTHFEFQFAPKATRLWNGGLRRKGPNVTGLWKKCEGLTVYRYNPKGKGKEKEQEKEMQAKQRETVPMSISLDNEKKEQKKKEKKERSDEFEKKMRSEGEGDAIPVAATTVPTLEKKVEQKEAVPLPIPVAETTVPAHAPPPAPAPIQRPVPVRAQGTTSLLGNVTVGAWSDDSGGSDGHDDGGRRQQAWHNERVATAEMSRKRKLKKSNWDMKLDEGKTKKSKGKSVDDEGRWGDIVNQEAKKNPFHRTQQKNANLNKGGRKGNEGTGANKSKDKRKQTNGDRRKR